MDITQLKVIQSSLKKIADGPNHIQVGIFGEKASRRDTQASGMTNAEVGFIHEMGSHEKNIPRRSFLWDTFTLHGDKLMASLKPDVELLLKKGNVDEYLKRCGQAAVALVNEAFETSGWGTWPQNSYRTILAKLRGSIQKRRQMAAEVLFEGAGHTRPLINTGQLWQAIASRVARS